MADVSSTLRAWSATAASNNPTGGTVIGAGLDDNLRQIQATVKQFLAGQATNMASATIDLTTADGFYVNVTGSTAITALGTEGAGIHYVLKFAAALTFTHNATSLILPGGANITTAAGDIAWVVSEGSGNWRCLFYSKASGVQVTGTQAANIVLAGPTTGAAALPAFRALVAADVPGLALNAGTSTASTSGTSVDFTSTIAAPKRVTLCLVGVSTNGTDNYYVQIGPSGGVATSGYLGTSSALAAGTASTNYTAAFGIRVADATNPVHGSITLTLENASTNTWVASGMLALSGAAQTMSVAGSVPLSGTLNKLRLTTSGGVNTFDAGEVNVIWE